MRLFCGDASLYEARPYPVRGGGHATVRPYVGAQAVRFGPSLGGFGSLGSMKFLGVSQGCVAACAAACGAKCMLKCVYDPGGCESCTDACMDSCATDC